MSEKVTVITHSSKFHTDDIFAVASLFILLGEEKVNLIRSRDLKVIETGDYVVDVGEVYDPEKKRFDHHQKGGAGKRENGVPYASFGLVWKEFSSQIAGNKKIAEKIEKNLVQPIDAADNGMVFLDYKIPGLHQIDINFFTYIFSPTWKEEININDVFLRLVSHAKEIILRLIKVYSDELEAEEKVLEAYNKARDKRLIEIDERYPWEEILLKFPEPIFVIYPKRFDNQWSIKTIRDDIFSYTPRKKLPESWGGKSGKDLEKITGVEGAVFCHNARFMAVAQTKEAVLKMAEIALAE